MRRRTFDALAATAGVLIAGLLLVAGGLLTWGHNFVTNEVHTQLAAQKIVFPPANSPAVAGPQFAPMRAYGGQLMTTGAQAQVYTDHFIANHLKAIGGGKTYAQLSAEAIAQPKNATLAAQVATVFKGETLRGLLLTTYGFSIFGERAAQAALVCFLVAAVLALATLAGLFHAMSTSKDELVLPEVPHEARTLVNA